MSGASLPYHLRPHKAVDRRLFVDLLARVERWQPLDKHVYLSMGAYPLEDHKLVHRVLGLRRLIAFDLDDGVVDRQRFNRPIDSCRCISSRSSDIIDNLDRVVEEAGHDTDSGIVFWLDYTSPGQLGQQVREFQSLLDKLRNGDVVRVTVNAHPHGLIEERGDRPVLLEDKQRRQWENLKSKISEFLPSSASLSDMTQEGLPAVLAAAFGKAADRALPPTGLSTFMPLSIMRYADGQQMLSITGMIVRRGEENTVASRMDLGGWPFASFDWKTVHRLLVPDLTLRERLFLEREVVSKSTEEIVDGLGFSQAADVEIGEFIENYKRYYRFYPTLLATDI